MSRCSLPAPPPADAVLVEVESALAGAVAARALRRAPPTVIAGASPPPAVAGAVAAIIAAAARRAHVGEALQVVPVSALAVQASCEPGAAWDVSSLGSGAVAVTLTVLLDEEAYAARVVVRSQRLHAARRLPWNRAILSRLGAMPLALPVVAVAQRSTVAEVEALGPGDVILQPRSFRHSPCGPLALEKTGELFGPVLLSPPGGSMGVRADLVGGRQLVVRGQEDPLDAEESTMTQGTGHESHESEAGGWVGAVGEVPVVLRVEIGEAVMAAREWASLSPGDVIGLGTRVGQQVLLRVGGVPVARAELVDLEGEVGVRIVARLGEEPTGR